MATVSVLNGTKLLVYLNGLAIGRATGGTLDISHAVRDITTKQSGGWQEFLEGLRSATISTEHLYAEDESVSLNELQTTVITTRVPVTIRVASTTAGDRYWEAQAWLTSLSLNLGAPEDNASFTASFSVTGVLTSGAST
jgi:hypothetical protein